jgi:hypothetical protein
MKNTHKKVPRTIDNTRETDHTMVQGEDDEVKGDEEPEFDLCSLV